MFHGVSNSFVSIGRRSSGRDSHREWLGRPRYQWPPRPDLFRCYIIAGKFTTQTLLPKGVPAFYVFPRSSAFMRWIDWSLHRFDPATSGTSERKRSWDKGRRRSISRPGNQSNIWKWEFQLAEKLDTVWVLLRPAKGPSIHQYAWIIYEDRHFIQPSCHRGRRCCTLVQSRLKAAVFASFMLINLHACWDICDASTVTLTEAGSQREHTWLLLTIFSSTSRFRSAVTFCLHFLGKLCSEGG